MQALLFVKLVEQCLGILQVGGIEALREPVVDAGKYRAGFVAAAFPREQPREARCSIGDAVGHEIE